MVILGVGIVLVRQKSGQPMPTVRSPARAPGRPRWAWNAVHDHL